MTGYRFAAALTGGIALTAPALAQVPDLLNALDAGGRAMGSGGSFGVTAADTLSGYYNPAGLGYVDKATLGITTRNLPRSRTRVGGDIANLRRDSDGTRGESRLSHVGIALPVKGGTFGLNYTIGGFVSDRINARNLRSGSNPVPTYSESKRLQTNFFTLAFARANRDQTASFGIGLTVAQADLDYRRQFTINPSGGEDTRLSSSGTGLGVILGAQFVPRGNPNLSYGLSYRSEIDLQGNSETRALYDKIPARLIGGMAYRQDGVRGGRDFLIYGVQVAHYFRTSNGPQFNRKAQTTLGAGIEYNLDRGNARIPIRLGFNAIPGGGDGFGSRNAITYGIGYRPTNGNFGLDLNFAQPESGGYDISFGLTYRFGK